jgi:hypothetical protein
MRSGFAREFRQHLAGAIHARQDDKGRQVRQGLAGVPNVRRTAKSSAIAQDERLKQFTMVPPMLDAPGER